MSESLVLTRHEYNEALDAAMAVAFPHEADAYPDRVGRGGMRALSTLVMAGVLAAGIGAADRDASPVREGAEVEMVMPSAPNLDNTELEVASPEAANTLRYEIAHFYQGINAERLVIGAEHIDWNARAESRGAASFGFETFKTCFDVSAFLNSNSDASKEAQKYMLRNAANSQIDLNKELERAKRGEGYLAIQSLDKTVLKGTTYLVVGKDGKVKAERADERITPEGDVMWIYVTADGKIIGDFSFRADCNQPGLEKIVPVPKDKKDIPDVTTSTTSTSTTSTSTTTTVAPTTTTTSPSTTTSTSTTTTTRPPTTTTSTSTTTTTRPPTTTTTLPPTTTTTLRQDDGITPGPGSPNTTVPPVTEAPTPDNGEDNPVGGARPTTTTTAPRPNTGTTTPTTPTTTIVIPGNGTPTNPNGPFVEQ